MHNTFPFCQGCPWHKKMGTLYISLAANIAQPLLVFITRIESEGGKESEGFSPCWGVIAWITICREPYSCQVTTSLLRALHLYLMAVAPFSNTLLKYAWVDGFQQQKTSDQTTVRATGKSDPLCKTLPVSTSRLLNLMIRFSCLKALLRLHCLL